jgi:dynactin complex subunit
MSEGTIRVGSKVLVSGKEELGPAIVRFIGTTKFAPGEWIGVEYDSAGMKRSQHKQIRFCSLLSQLYNIYIFFQQHLL